MKMAIMQRQVYFLWFFFLVVKNEIVHAETLQSVVRSRSVIPPSIRKELANLNSTEDFIAKFLEQGISSQGSERPGVSPENDTDYTILKNKTEAIKEILFPDPHEAAPDPNGAAIAESLFTEPENCKPILIGVSIPKDPSPDVFIWPQCVALHRCGGCCGDELFECAPSNVMAVTVSAMKTRFNATTQKLKYEGVVELEMWSHEECECRCSVQAYHCSAKHEYIADACRCKCKNELTAQPCRSFQRWDDFNCACVCREVMQCHDHEYFNRQICRCSRFDDNDQLGLNASICVNAVCRAGYRPHPVNENQCECFASTVWGDSIAANVPEDDSVDQIEVEEETTTTTVPPPPTRRPRPRPTRRRMLRNNRRPRRNVETEE